MTEFDPDLLREWSQMLSGIAEEMANVANNIDPSDSYQPNVLSVDPGTPTGVAVLSAEEYAAVRAGILYVDYRGSLVQKEHAFAKVIVAPPEERADYTYMVREDMNRENFMRDPIRNRDRGKIIHLQYQTDKGDGLRVRVL